MGWFRKANDPSLALAQVNPELEALRQQVRERDGDRWLALEVIQALKPGLEARILAEIVYNGCAPALGLATFFLALADWDRDLLAFPFYSEGGKARVIPIETLSGFTGLTAGVLYSGRSAYYATKALQEEAGVVYTEAERVTELIPESWYGVPLGVGPGWSERPFGVLSFQAFAPEAFSPARREAMEAIGATLSLAFRADPARILVMD